MNKPQNVTAKFVFQPTLTVLPATGSFGQSLRLSAVLGTPPSSVNLTGCIDFYVAGSHVGKPVCNMLKGGTASTDYTVNILTPGPVTITAVFTAANTPSSPEVAGVTSTGTLTVSLPPWWR
jgi:hypothetical protein